MEIDARAHGDKEQPQQQTFERFEVGFEFVPEFRACQHHTGQKGPKGR